MLPFHHVHLGWMFRSVLKDRLLEHGGVQSSEHSVRLFLHLDIELWRSKPLIWLWLPVRCLHWRLLEHCRAGHGAYGLSLEDALGEAVAFISPAQLLACWCFEATSPSGWLMVEQPHTGLL